MMHQRDEVLNTFSTNLFLNARRIFFAFEKNISLPSNLKTHAGVA